MGVDPTVFIEWIGCLARLLWKQINFLELFFIVLFTCIRDIWAYEERVHCSKLCTLEERRNRHDLTYDLILKISAATIGLPQSHTVHTLWRHRFSACGETDLRTVAKRRKQVDRRVQSTSADSDNDPPLQSPSKTILPSLFRTLSAPSTYLVLERIYRVAQNWHIFVRLNFIKYYPIFEIISLSESGENA